MLLLVFYNVRSERELMATLPERLDWLCFLDLDLDTDIPDHSVLAKARRRWGEKVFKTFFERIVWQCVQAGLVDGRKLFVDASLIDADASNNSIVDTHSLRYPLSRHYEELERRLQAMPEPDNPDPTKRPVNRRYVSTTDPEAAIVGRGKPKLTYQAHRAVDSTAEVITATRITPGDVNETHLLLALADAHQAHTGCGADTVVTDSKYGTIENYLACYDRGIAAHLPDLKKAADKRATKRQIFPDTLFAYDVDSDIYRCPAGQRLKRKSLHRHRQSLDYAPKKVCAACALRPHCTQNKMGRSIKRHLRPDALDAMRVRTRSSPARRDIRTRQHLMERSFARAARYGSGRARWRGRWRVEIQEYLTAAIQNIEVLMRYGRDPRKRPAVIIRNWQSAKAYFTDLISLFCRCEYAGR